MRIIEKAKFKTLKNVNADSLVYNSLLNILSGISSSLHGYISYDIPRDQIIENCILGKLVNIKDLLIVGEWQFVLCKDFKSKSSICIAISLVNKRTTRLELSSKEFIYYYGTANDRVSFIVYNMVLELYSLYTFDSTSEVFSLINDSFDGGFLLWHDADRQRSCFEKDFIFVATVPSLGIVNPIEIDLSGQDLSRNRNYYGYCHCLSISVIDAALSSMQLFSYDGQSFPFPASPDASDFDTSKWKFKLIYNLISLHSIIMFAASKSNPLYYYVICYCFDEQEIRINWMHKLHAGREFQFIILEDYIAFTSRDTIVINVSPCDVESICNLKIINIHNGDIIVSDLQNMMLHSGRNPDQCDYQVPRIRSNVFFASKGLGAISMYEVVN